LVKKLSGTSWQPVGGVISAGHTSYTNIFSDRNGTLYLAYVDNDNGHRLAVKTFDAGSGTWEPLGGNDNNLYVSTGSVVNGVSQLSSSHNSWMAFDSLNVPYIVYAEMDDGGHPYVKKFNAGTWKTVGGGPVSATDKASGVGIAISTDGHPYIAYSAGTGSTGQLVAYGFSGIAWTSMNVPEPLPNGRHTSNIRHPAITIADGVLYVIYMDTKNSNKATVISSPLDAPDWNQVGSTLSGRDVSYPDIAHDAAGNLYASFIDVISNKSGRSVTRVMKFETGATGWAEEPDSGATDGIDEPSSNLALSVGNNYSPYIVYLRPYIGDTSTPVVRYLPVTIVKPNDTTVTVKDDGTTVTVSNGIVTATIEKSSATVTSLIYKGVNMLEGGYSGGKIYWSWNMPNYQNPSGCTYTLVADPKTNKGTYAELQFHMKWDGSASEAAMDVDIYYSLPRTAQGIYASAMLTHPTAYPANPGGEWRMASYVGSMFDWLSVDSLRNRLMASPADWAGGTVPDGAPPEVELLNSGIYAGQYECKYDYSADFGDLDAWGWSSTTQDLGIWVTVPSREYYNGGPMKRELTGHNGPTLLNMLGGQHYGMGGDGAIAAGEYWQKVFGPFLIYCNSVPDGTQDAPAALWADALDQASKEQSQWPYSWYKNPQYVQQSGRGTVSGKLVIADTTDPKASAAGMWVGVAATPLSENAVTDFQLWSKNYQFWIKTDSDGNFTIPHVLPGTYNLYAFGPGAAGQLTRNNFVTVTAGGTASLGEVDWTPERTAPTVWQIGIPDRTAAEFLHGTDWWRSDSLPSTHWGKFMDYPDEFPDGVNYTIGKSDWSTDWNYVEPYDKNVMTSSPVWTVNFNLTDNPTPGTTAALYIAYAAHYQAANIVTVNGTNISDPSTGVVPPNASDAMVRKGIHGAFSDHRFTFPANLLHAGNNKITLTLRVTGGGSSGDIMYDYLRLEAWGVEATTKNYQTITFDSIAEHHLNDGDFQLNATATSGLAITYTSSDSSVAYVEGKTLHMLSTGTATITASQPGDSTWLAAKDVLRVVNITVPRNELSITVDGLSVHYLGEPDFTLSATSTSGLPVQFTSNNPAAAAVSGGVVHLEAVGPVTITAIQPGDDTWLPDTVSQSFQVRAIDKPSYNRLVTPNGDGVNDKLVIDNVNAYPDNELQVFDEAGKMIYHKRGYDNSWDVRLSGKIIAKGTYYFILRSAGAVRIKGSFTVIH
jgi:rhamnogalacturonan endolyase